MAITKEEVIAKAKELSLTLTEDQIADLVNKDKLPDEELKSELKKAEILEKVKDPAKAIEMIDELYKESKKRQAKTKELQDKLDAIEAEKKKAENEKLLADGKFQEIIDKQNKELEDLKPFKEKFEGLSTKIRTNLLNKVKSEDREFAETLTDEQLLVYTEKYAISEASGTHVGQPPVNGQTRKLTEAEQKEMIAMNLDNPKDYLEIIEIRTNKESK